MKHTILSILLLFSVFGVAQTNKKFAVHYDNMVGTHTDDIHFSQFGNDDQWAPGDVYYPTKDLSRIKYIGRYFPCRDLVFSKPDLVLRPGYTTSVDISFLPEESVVRYVDKIVYSSNPNVAKAVRITPDRLLVTAVTAGMCTLTVTHSEAGDHQINVLVQPDEDYVDRMVDSLLNLMNDEEKFKMVGGTNWYYTHSVDRLGIPQMQMCDGPQGVGSGKATAYPCNQALAATWNRQLAQRYGHSLARDCRARGIDIILGPAVNIYRGPLCGRNFEYMGEDPYLAGQTAANYIIGAQSNGISTVVKHFLGNNSDYDRDHISNDMDERTMNEIYLPAFKAAVQEGKTGCLMTSYNLVNGVYTTHSYDLLTTILRDRWGFKGTVMSDWGSTHDGLAAARAGLDLEMASGDNMSPANLRSYIANGDLTMAHIDAKVRHILYTMISRGFWDGGQIDSRIPLDDPTSDSTALAVARESMTLLRNPKGVLPIDTSKVKRIVVTGKNATGYVSGGGSGNVGPHHYVDMYTGIKRIADELGIQVECKDRFDLLPAIMFTDSTLTQNGLNAEYFNSEDLSGAPVLKRVETKVNYIWSGRAPEVDGLDKKNFSIRWSGYISVPASSVYTFTAGGDDGFRLFIDGTNVLDDWTASSYHQKTVSKSFTKGRLYHVVFEYYQLSGDSRVDFAWAKRGDTQDYLASYLSEADLVIACFGCNSTIDGEGHDRSFDLQSEDKELLKSIKASGTPTVAVLNGGGAFEMESWQGDIDAILWAYYGGQQAGTAAADLLFGRANPSGHLPYSFDRAWSENPSSNYYHDPDGDKHVKYGEGIFMGYRGYDKLGRTPLYPFGHGLSYTTFELADIEVGTLQADSTVQVTCTLTNTGKMQGAQVVQLYVGRQGGSVQRPVRELRDFQKVDLAPGQSQRVTFQLRPAAFSYYKTAVHDFVYDPGQYKLELGFSSRDIRLTQTTQLP